MKPFFLFITLLYSMNVGAQVCNEDEGAELYGRGEFRQSFDQLAGCEDKPGVNAITLGILSELYGSPELAAFETPRDRYQKIYDLTVRSALLGQQEMVSALMEMFTYGEPLVSLPPQPEKASCLERFLDQPGELTPSNIEACLELAERGDSRAD